MTRYEEGRPILGALAYTGWLVRRLTGVNEAHLALVPHERGRYTALGWVMVGTAGMAFIGMAVLLTLVADLPVLVIAALATGWSLFILGFDYAVVTYLDEHKAMADAQSNFGTVVEDLPSKGSKAGRRFGVRILVAIVLGVFIGESMVIAIFGTQSTRTLDEARVRALEKDICNLDAQMNNFRPEVEPSPRCASLFAGDGATANAYSAFVKDSSSSSDNATTGQDSTADPFAARTEETRTALKTNEARIVKLDEEIKHFNRVATCERYPSQYSEQERKALGCSGLGGEGERYKEAVGAARNAQAERARLETATQALRTKLTDIENQLTGLLDVETKAKAAATEDERTVRSEARDSKTAVEIESARTVAQGEIDKIQAGNGPVYGLSERFTATEEAVDPWLRWGVRLFFIIVDTAPVLLAMTFGVSAVERMVAIRQRMAVYPFMQDLTRVDAAYRDGERVQDYMGDDPADERWSRPRLSVGLALGRAVRQIFGGEPAEVITNPENATDDARVPRSDSRIPLPAPANAPRSSAPSGASFLQIDNHVYEKLQQIGDGKYATVHFVRPHPWRGDTQLPFVAKLPSEQTDVQELACQALTAEFEMYRLLHASNSVPYMEYGKPGKLIVLRYYPRTSIDRWIFQDLTPADTWISRQFSLDQLLKWTQQIIKGLVDIWSLRYVHGDGKPANLVITGPAPGFEVDFNEPRDVLKLIDLGSAVALDQPVPTVTPGYAPPEALVGKGNYAGTPLTDIYSFLGATLYYLCSGGIPPYWDHIANDYNIGDEKLAAAWIQASKIGPPTRLSDLNPRAPAALVSQIERWMAQDPNDRLLTGSNDRPDWMQGSDWQVRRIRERIDEQHRMLFKAIIAEVGTEVFQKPLFGERHVIAPRPADLPDLAFHVSEYDEED